MPSRQAHLLETLLSHVDSIPYLQKRLDGWTQDLSQMTDQTVQSLYAIGSGGLKGLGLGNSVEKQLWLPESTNDFIFSAAHGGAVCGAAAGRHGRRLLLYDRTVRYMPEENASFGGVALQNAGYDWESPIFGGVVYNSFAFAPRHP